MGILIKIYESIFGKKVIKYTSLFEGRMDGNTNPYYSIKGDVYHNNKDCGPGSLIPEEYLRYGTDNRRLCDDCKDIND